MNKDKTIPPLSQTAVSGSDDVCNHDFVIKFGVYECQNCGVSKSETLKSCNHFWKMITKNYYKCSWCDEKHYR